MDFVLDTPEPFWYNTPMNTNVFRHDFSDFDMPKTYGLVDPTGVNCRVYIPNPWHTDEIRVHDYSLYPDGIWRFHGGKFMHIDDARLDWKKMLKLAYTPRDIMENPLNESKRRKWDLWAGYFGGHSQFFDQLVAVYGDYPKKMVVT